MEQIIDIGEYGDRVRLDGGRIVIHRTDGTCAAVPVRDVAVLMFSEPGLSVSVAVLAELAKNGGTAVACDRTHTPVGVFQPLAVYSRATAVLLGQIAARPVLRARLWQRVVQAKILSQARMLERCGRRDAGLKALARKVRRGDVENVEGHAALRYWRRLGLFERRDRTAPDANRPLNYAYAILYGSSARALCCAGLNTALGINHRGPTNPHCLASDLMEPFRPAADAIVYDWLTDNPGAYDLTTACRRHILKALLSTRWQTGQGVVPFFAALSHAAVSLRECLLNDSVELELPEQVHEEDEDVDARAV